jgi:energy-coupling factor transporter ATP-binding protein EcfA2
MLSVNNLSYSYPEGSAPALSGVSLHVCPGECICVTGHSGCGKTTLLLAIKGLLRDGTVKGDVGIDTQKDKEESHRDTVGIVFQNAETQILCATVAEEVAFGPENLCVPADEIRRRIGHSLAAANLEGFANRNVERMSAGQKHRLAIASVLSMNPRVLLLDEPTSQLDATGKAELARVLKELKGKGYALLIAEHNLETFADFIDRYLLMEKGHVVRVSDHLAADFFHCGENTYKRYFPGAAAGTPPAVVICGLRLSYPDIGEVLKDITLEVPCGERIHLFGQNGSGKSSFLRCMAGVAKPDSGSIRVAGVSLPGRANLLGKVGFLFQNPQRQLFENTVYDEVAFSLKRLRLSSGEIRRHVMEALAVCEADHLAERLPLSLSFGEQHRVALASVLAPRPEVLLLDEPFSGLDLGQRHRLLNILADLRERYSTTVLIASHDPLPDPDWADRIITLENGTIGQH